MPTTAAVRAPGAYAESGTLAGRRGRARRHAEGGRAFALNKAAYHLGQLIAAGTLDDATAESALYEAASVHFAADRPVTPAEAPRVHPRRHRRREAAPARDRRVNAASRDGAAALDDARAFIARFCALPVEHAYTAVTLWAAHAWALDAFDSTPRLAFLSPEPGSGKTRALEILTLLVPWPMHAVNATPAALFRSVADPASRRTILFDEIDTIFGPKAKEHEELRGLLNAGHRRSGVAYRCVGEGTRQEVVAFPAYAGVALAGLGQLPDTILTRAVVIRMRRRAPHEHIEPFRARIHEPEGKKLASARRLGRHRHRTHGRKLARDAARRHRPARRRVGTPAHRRRRRGRPLARPRPRRLHLASPRQRRPRHKPRHPATRRPARHLRRRPHDDHRRHPRPGCTRSTPPRGPTSKARPSTPAAYPACSTPTRSSPSRSRSAAGPYRATAPTTSPTHGRATFPRPTPQRWNLRTSGTRPPPYPQGSGGSGTCAVRRNLKYRLSPAQVPEVPEVPDLQPKTPHIPMRSRSERAAKRSATTFPR